MMSSLVTDVLHSAGKLAKENIASKIDTLKRKVEDIKLEVQESLKNRYIEFLPQYIKLDKFIENLGGAAKEYEVLHNQIEKEVKPQMSNSVAEFRDVLEDLKKIKVLKSVVSDLAQMHKHLDTAKSSLFQSMYFDATENLLKFENIFKDVSTECSKDVEIYCALRTEFFVTKEQVIYHLQKAWQKKIILSSTKEGKHQRLKAAITFTKNSQDEVVDILTSLKNLKYLHQTLKEFGKQFLSLICEPLLLNNTEIEKTNTSDSSTLTITAINEHSPDPHQVFEKLEIVFKFLNAEFFAFPLTLYDDDCKATTAMSELGNVLGDNFCSIVIEKCLKPAIPKQSKQLETFHKEIENAQNFNNLLVQIGFFSELDNKLLQFIHNVDTLPVNKMAQDILSRSRVIMQHGLHQTMIVGTEESPPFTVAETKPNLNEMARTKSGLSKSSFIFPRCQISISAKDFVTLFHEVMTEAKNIGPDHSARLYYVARSICELYCCVAPTYHKEEIANIPQQTAIFHNNCMYIAHSLLILGARYQCELRLSLPMTFVDLVPEIRKLGTEAFLAQMRRQRQQLLQLLLDKQAFRNIAIDDGLVNNAEKSVRQCLCQLQLLKKVWSDVLPVDVYFKSVGTLCNSCLEEIIMHILSMEDIAAETAAQFDSIFSILLKQAPDLFKVSSIDKSNLVHNYVRRWFKFQELQLILSLSMKEIVDRWSSGKGPLASHFTADEVKHLIRALFQNTERRAASLAKIR